MKKLLILLFAAAVVGIIVSRGQETEPADQQPEPAAAQDASNDSAASAVEPDRSASSRSERPLAIAWAESRESRAEEPESAPAEKKLERAPEAAPRKETAPSPEPEPARAVPAVATEALPVLQKGRELREQGKLNEAREVLSAAYRKARGKEAEALQAALDPLCQELIFNPRNVDIARVHSVEPGENLTAIGRKYGVSWRLIARLNDMDENDIRRMRVGRKLKIITAQPSLVVWKSEFRMALFFDGVYVKEYSIGTGKNNKTPTGVFTVNNMMVRAPWTAPDGKVYHYGDEGYQLGERWIAFDDQPGASGIGIHGTHDESSIGTMCSNGCLRMKNRDVVELYDLLRNGTKVKIME